MNKFERIKLLNKVAGTVNHDINGCFVEGEAERLNLIQELLSETDYILTEIGLCHLYSKTSISEIGQDMVVLSSHIDTHRNITKPFSEIWGEKKLCGTYDNSITNAAILTLMLENKLPDNVIIAFTGNEEYGMAGAKDVCSYLKRTGIDAKVIVTDVTDRGYKGKNVFTIENRCNSGKWTTNIENTAVSSFKGKLKDNYADDETCIYSKQGFECLSLCIPTKGEMHSNEGLKARISTFNKYIEVLNLLANR